MVVHKVANASYCFQSVFEEDLDKVLHDYTSSFILKQLCNSRLIVDSGCSLSSSTIGTQ